MSNKSRYVVVAIVVGGLLSGVGYWQYLKSHPNMDTKSASPLSDPATAPAAAPASTAAPSTGMAAIAPAKPPANSKELGSMEMALGNPNAKVTVIEYASMTCPHCAHFDMDVFPQLKQNYIDTGRIKYVFREFPLDGLALAASMLARCAGPERYFAMIDLLYRNQPKWITQHPKEDLAALVKTAGIGQAQFDQCTSDKDLQTAIAQTAKDGQDLYAIDSTPTVLVNGKKLTAHAYEDLQKAINDAEQEAK